MQILLKKNIEFVSSKRDDIVAFELGLVLLLAEIDFIIEKESCKKDILRAYCTGCVKIVLALLTEVIALYVEAIIVQIIILGFQALL